jgi:Zn-dependent peptidase ImmA (M78 family)/transcriptional regulator with XRE-family HTH domain
MTSAPLNPEVLIVARESRGCTQDDLAGAAGVTQGLISKAEKGVSSLSTRHVAAIAERLGYPVQLFYETGRVREVGSACLYHRKRKTLPAKVLKRLDARMYVRNMNVNKLLDGLEIEGDRTFHTMDPDEYGGDPVAVAKALRAAWRVPDGPISNLTALIESAGGIVLLEDFGHRKLFGMSCWTSRGHPLFFLNSTVPTADLRWTMAHELGHLTMHGTPPDGDPETEADAFAGEFLAPAALFKADVRGLTFDRLPQLKAYWGLSMKGIIKRAQTVGAIDKKTAIRLYKQHSARGYNSAEPYPLKPEPPTLVDTAIGVHLGDHGFRRDELAEAMLLSLNEFSSEFLRAAPEEQPPSSPSDDKVINLADRRRATDLSSA